MRIILPLVFLVLLQCFASINVSATSKVTVSSNYLTLKGNAHIKFLEPQESFWAGLSDAHRYPVIHSGDLIAFRWAHSSYPNRWIMCSSSSYCQYSTCPGNWVFKSSKWSSCRKPQFYIRAVNKNDGQPINSGDYVTLAPYSRGSTCRLRCGSSSSAKCSSGSCVSESYFKGNNAFSYSYLTFQIFSRNSKDGVDPIQFGDIVAFRYPYYYPHYWLYFSGSYLYANSCSSNNKYSCAAKNSHFGFQIFKKL